MRANVNYLKCFIALVAICTATFSLKAQSIEEAQEAYNAGVTAKGEGNLEGAISSFVSCIEQCEVLVEENEDENAETMLSTAQGLVPKLYLQLGSEQIQAQKTEEGLTNLAKAKEYAGYAGDEVTISKVDKMVPQVYYKSGVTKYKAADLDGSIADFDKAIEANPNFVSAYYLKTVVYKKKGDDENLKATASKGIEVAESKGDAKNKAKIVKLASSHFLKKGNAAKGATKYAEAIDYLNTSLEFNDKNATALFLLATTYSASGKHTEAIGAGEKAVANTEGTAEDKAKIYMVIAESNAKKGNTTAACAAYKKAAVGQYAELANYRIQHELKCK